WDEPCQQQFAHDLCKVFVSCNISWNVADHTEFRLSLRKWLPNVVVPGRRSLSGIHLNHAAMEAHNGVVTHIGGQYAMGQYDGWKNVAKTNLVSSVMSIKYEPYLVKTHNMTGKLKTGDHIFELIKSDIHHMEETYKVQVIGWCTNDGLDGKKACRLLYQFLTYLIVIACWAHQ
ncbi:hypothetical protein C8Q70DRAFT_878385, partial [Cubamyces menziesii]